MANQKNHITNSTDYQRYLEGSMTSKERHEFEKQLLDDAFEAEALEGLSEVGPEQLPQDLGKLSLRLQAKTKNSSSAMYLRIAASVLILALFSYMVFFLIGVNTSPEFAQSNEKTEEEKALIPHEKKEVLKDSIKEEPERIIAYQQEVDKMAEEKPAALPSKIKATPIEEEVEDMDIDLEVIEESDKGLYDREEVQAAEPVTLPTLAFEEAPVEIDPEARKKSIVATETVPPTSMQKSRVSARTDNLRTVTGKIVSGEDNDPVPGVNVIVKGSSEGTISDMEGNYKIDVPEDEHATLVYSYIGLHSKEVKVKDQKNIDVAMEPDLLNQLTEVVVTTNGYEVEPGSNSAPRPEIGYQNWKEYIKANLRYPESGLVDKTKGVVVLKFSVGIDGQILNMEVQKSLGEEFDKEAVRLVLEGPKWEPAIENDSTVVREVKLKIRFRPEN